MKPTAEYSAHLAGKIAELDARLDRLEQEIREIGLPAAQDLCERLYVIKIEERALKRNIEESLAKGEPDSVRMEKIGALLRHIENEEKDVERDADFLHQAAPSSMTLAVEAGARIVDLYRRGMKKVVGDHHPLGESVFVNNTHEGLAREHGISAGDGAPEPEGR